MSPFTTKDWKDEPDTSTPLSAAALENMETRLSGYTDSELTAHTADTTNVHGIADTSALATTSSVTSAVSAHEADTTNVHGIANTANLETATGSQAKVDAHVNDTSAAHAASAISFTPTGTIAATDVQAALAEVASEAGGGGGTASSVSFTPTGSVASTNVQDAIAEVAAEAGGGSSQPSLTSTGTTGNLGTTLTVDFASTAREKRYSGTLNGNLAVTVQNPVAGSTLILEGVQDATGGRTLTIAGQSVTIPSAAGAVISVEARWYDASTARIVSAGVETDATATTAINNHIADTTAAHAAGSISYNGSTDLSATDVEAALDELDNEKAAKLVSINAQTGTSYTLVAGDAGKLVTVSNAATHTLTVPPNSSVAFSVGTVVNVARLGAGAVNVAAGAGVTVSSPGGVLGLRAQYSQATLIKTATDTWLLAGDIA